MLGVVKSGVLGALRRAVMLACVALATANGAARASEPEIAGMGARSSAMAGTGAADVDGYDATYTNPAGLISSTRRRLTLGYVYGHYHLRMDGAARPVDDTNGVVLGAAVPLGFTGVMRDRLAIGLGFYFPTGVLNRARTPFPDEARLALLDTRTQVVSALVGIAARVHPRLNIGVGVLVLATMTGNVVITPDAGGRLQTQVEEQIVVNYTPIVGLQAHVARGLKLGLVYRGESRAGYDVQIHANLGDRLPIEIPLLRVAGVAQYDPTQIALEAAWQARPWLLVAGGVTWKHWSAFPLPSENATAAAPMQPATGFHDTAVPRIALEAGGRLGRVRLYGRAGYAFEWSPAGVSTVLIDADRHLISGGLGLAWQHRYGTLQLDGFAQWHQLADSSRASGGFVLCGLTLGEDL